MREVSRTAPLTLKIVMAGLVPAIPSHEARRFSDRDHRDNPSQPLVATLARNDKRGFAEGPAFSAVTARLSHIHA
jgi:hypothetical protein